MFRFNTASYPLTYTDCSAKKQPIYIDLVMAKCESLFRYEYFPFNGAESTSNL